MAYAPYSKVQVGAAVLTEEGEVHAGCNVENASFGLTLCAERCAVARAVAGGQRRLRAIAIATSLDDPLMPCGACRQFLHEFAPGMIVVSQGAKGPHVQTSLAQLLPRAFGPSDLA